MNEPLANETRVGDSRHIKTCISRLVGREKVKTICIGPVLRVAFNQSGVRPPELERSFTNSARK